MAGKLTQTQIVAALSEKTGMAKKDVKGFLAEVADLAHKEAKKNGEFTFPGVGKLVKQKRKARTGRNPATGEPIKIPAKTVLKFRIAKAAKDAVLGMTSSAKKR
jgi:DNA-binding protein HU-beta